MYDHVIIVGGYGAVGRLISHQLCQLYTSTRVTVAGRNATRCKKTAAELKCSWLRLDLNDSSTWLRPTAKRELVLVCVDCVDTAFTKHVVESGYDYVDITASRDLTTRLESLNEVAIKAKRRVLLSIGIAPGLSNLMAAACASVIESVQRIEIGLRFGIGDTHGPAATKWTLDNLGIGKARHVWFPDQQDSIGLAAAFSDQYVLQRTLGIPDVSTTVTLENRAWTRSVEIVLPLLRRIGHVGSRFGPLLRSCGLATDRCEVAIRAFGESQGKPDESRLAFSGRNESLLTAQFAVRSIELLSNVRSHGVFHSNELFTLKQFGSPWSDGAAEQPRRV